MEPRPADRARADGVRRARRVLGQLLARLGAGAGGRAGDGCLGRARAPRRAGRQVARRGRRQRGRRAALPAARDHARVRARAPRGERRDAAHLAPACRSDARDLRAGAPRLEERHAVGRPGPAPHARARQPARRVALGSRCGRRRSHRRGAVRGRRRGPGALLFLRAGRRDLALAPGAAAAGGRLDAQRHRRALLARLRAVGRRAVAEGSGRRCTARDRALHGARRPVRHVPQLAGPRVRCSRRRVATTKRSRRCARRSSCATRRGRSGSLRSSTTRRVSSVRRLAIWLARAGTTRRSSRSAAASVPSTS